MVNTIIRNSSLHIKVEVCQIWYRCHVASGPHHHPNYTETKSIISYYNENETYCACIRYCRHQKLEYDTFIINRNKVISFAIISESLPFWCNHKALSIVINIETLVQLAHQKGHLCIRLWEKLGVQNTANKFAGQHIIMIQVWRDQHITCQLASTAHFKLLKVLRTWTVTVTLLCYKSHLRTDVHHLGRYVKIVCEHMKSALDNGAPLR